MERTHQLLLKILVGFFAVVMGVLAIKIHWADTELWAISASKALFQEKSNHSLSYKFFFHTFMYPLYWLDLNNIQTLHAARFLFYSVGMGILLLVYQISETLFANQKKSLWAVFLVVTSTFFLSRGFRVRSDLLACFFQLLYFLSYLRFRKNQDFKWCFVALFSLAFMLLSTPKSILFLLVIIVYMLMDFVKNKKLDEVAQFCTISALPVVIVMAILMVLKIEVVISVHDFFMNSFKDFVCLEKPVNLIISGIDICALACATSCFLSLTISS
ncbi:MAG: glycosyltransferase family 39 protein, partial [Bdellovibrionales bacterium]|nr:glycosyltransferase family 39 protein [Bdellovibrionales bacterium]